MTFPLVSCSSDNIDAVKNILTYRIWEITGRRPQLQCFARSQETLSQHIQVSATCAEAVYCRFFALRLLPPCWGVCVCVKALINC